MHETAGLERELSPQTKWLAGHGGELLEPGRNLRIFLNRVRIVRDSSFDIDNGNGISGPIAMK